jgi:hypothetical protein
MVASAFPKRLLRSNSTTNGAAVGGQAQQQQQSAAIEEHEGITPQSRPCTEKSTNGLARTRPPEKGRATGMKTQEVERLVRKAASAVALPVLRKLALLEELDFSDPAEAVQDEIAEMLEAAQATAAGEKGDSHKYEKAALTVAKRWRVFVAVKQYQDKEPTIGMAKEFAAFMFTTRQYRSREEKTGLSDSAI